MFYPLNRDLKRVFSEFFFLRLFCVSYFVLYLLFIFVFHLTYVWSMAISFVIVVALMVIYVFCHKRKMKTTLDHLWMSETEIKIEKVSKILDEHGFSSNNEKLFLLMEHYKDKIKSSEGHHDIISFILSVLLTFLPIIITSEEIDPYIITQIASCIGILLLIYFGYYLFKKIWNSTVADLFNGQAFVKSIYEILFYIYCRKLNDSSSEKKNLKKVAYELKRSH